MSSYLKIPWSCLPLSGGGQVFPLFSQVLDPCCAKQMHKMLYYLQCANSHVQHGHNILYLTIQAANTEGNQDVYFTGNSTWLMILLLWKQDSSVCIELHYTFVAVKFMQVDQMLLIMSLVESIYFLSDISKWQKIFYVQFK